MRAARLDLLRRTQRAHPADLWANFELGLELERIGRPAEAIRYYTAALALRPDNSGFYGNRGNALRAVGELDAALADYRQAVGLAPQSFVAHVNLSAGLLAKGQPDLAIAECREAIRLKPDCASAHGNLGAALRAKGQLDEAIAVFREATRLKRDFQTDQAKMHFNLGLALQEKGRLEEAIAAYREAVRIRKDNPEAHCLLGLALVDKGEFLHGLAELRLGHEQGSRTPRWLFPSAQWLHNAERLAALNARLPKFLEGVERPADFGECLVLALLCRQHKHYYAASARWFEAAFALQPASADDLSTGNRYNAACAAALAGCGRGKDADKLSEKERARLRGQALCWLRADLGAWGHPPGKLPDRSRLLTARTMRRWLTNADLAGVRGAEALARLPEAERPAWQKLWTDVTDLLSRAERTTPAKK